MKKLQLNKQSIAYLDNPERVFGGEGEAAQGTQTINGATCNQLTCQTIDPVYETDGLMRCKACADLPPDL